MPETSRASTLRPRLFALLKIALGVGLLWLLHHRGLLDPSRILAALVREPLWMGATVVLHGAVFALLGVRWRLLARAGGIGIRHAVAQRLTFVSHFFSTCLPGNGAGDLVKGALLSRTGIAFSEVLGTMAVDRVAGMAGLFCSWNACMLAIGVLHPELRSLLFPILPFTAGVAILLVGSLFATSPLAAFATTWTRRLPSRGLVGRIAAQATAMLERMDRCAERPGPVALGLGLSLVVQVCFLATALCAARSLGLPLGILEVGAVLPLAALANAIPVSPGGLGVGESVASVALARLGHPSSSGAELMIVVRMAVMVWALFGGILYALSAVPGKVSKP